MTLLISNEIVERTLTMKECIEVQEEAFKALETGAAIHRPRIDMYAPTDAQENYYRWGTMEGWFDGIFAIRLKSDIVEWPRTTDGSWTEEKFCVEPGTYCGLVMIFSSKNGEPLAIINDGILQHMRVGGGAGIGAKYLAKKGATTVGMLGSGGMARTFLRAFCEVRPINQCRVFSPTKANREAFAKEMSRALNIEVIPVNSAKEAVQGVDIVSTATDSMKPTFEADWLEPGMHIANLGPFEVSVEAEQRFDIKIRQGIAGLAMPHSHRVRSAVGMSPVAWIAGNEEELARLPPKVPGIGFKVDYPDFCDLAFGRVPGRQNDDEITYYYNIGNQGLQFAAVGGCVLKNAIRAGLGQAFPTASLLQNIRD
jgi:ornithine cyclodeaminase/alanine dehydrogenase-like protein (mu-crystallin family)